MTLKQIILGPVGQDGSAIAIGDAVSQAKAGLSQGIVLNGGTATFVAFDEAGGDYGIRVTQGTDVLSMRWAASAASPVYSESILVKVDALPSGTQQLFHTIRHASGVVLRFFLTSAGQIAIESSSNGVGRQSIVTGVTAGSTYRLTTVLELGASAAAGSISVKAYTGNTTNPAGTAYASAAYTLGIANLAALDAGLLTTPAAGGSVTLADLQFNDGSNIEIGPYTPPAAPTSPVRPKTVSANAGEWTASSGTDLVTPLIDESDATYVQGTSAGPIVYDLPALSTGDVTIDIRARWATGAQNVKIELYQGTLLIASRTTTLTNAFAAYALKLTAGENSLLTTPRTNLTVRITPVAV